MKQVRNFSAGPAMLPESVMARAQEEFRDYGGLGVSVIEISHRSSQFAAILEATDALLTELAGIPPHFKILYVHGGAQMQFAAIPLNLLGRRPAAKVISLGPLRATAARVIGRRPAPKASYVETGNFARLARQEAERYGAVTVAATGAGSWFSRIPDFDPARQLDPDSRYVHITANNTVYGTRWPAFPATGSVPLVADMTSEFLSRRLDFDQFGVIYAGLQKNLGPAGLAVVIIREDLLGHALPMTPALLNYQTYADAHSLANTTNTFAIYMMKLVLEWLRDEGGVDALEARNEAKAKLLYDVIDETDFYRGHAARDHRSRMNVCFDVNVPDLVHEIPRDSPHGMAVCYPARAEVQQEFLTAANDHGLYALKGHRSVGGMRASIYNAMPEAGCRDLADFMRDFARRKG